MKKKILAIILSVATVAVIFTGCGTSSQPSASDSAVSEETGAEAVHTYDILKRQEFNAEPNTQEMLDQIDITAEKSCEDLTEEQETQMMKLFVQNNDEFYDSNDQMELYIWLGDLLIHKYGEGDLYNALGYQLLESVIPVYMGEAEEDDAEIEEARQGFDDLLAEIYDGILEEEAAATDEAVANE